MIKSGFYKAIERTSAYFKITYFPYNFTMLCLSEVIDLMFLDTLDPDIRKAWADGKYKGVRPEWAKAWMEIS